MSLYKSGNATVHMNFLKEDERQHYEFTVRIKGNENFIYKGSQYSCPKNWNEEKIASDMIGWALDVSPEEEYALFDAVVFDETVKNENVVKIESKLL